MPYQNKANEIVALLSSKEHKTEALISRSVIVLCGIQGSGKTSSIELANVSFSEDEQIAECYDLLQCKNADEAYNILMRDTSSYEGCTHIAYSILNAVLGKSLSDQGVAVIFY